MHAAGEDSQAAKFYRQATHLLEASHPGDNRIQAQILADLGWLHPDQGDYFRGGSYAEQALSMRRRLGGEDNVEVASSRIEVAIAQQSQGHLSEAESVLEQALSIRRKKFPAWHPLVIYAEVALGEVFLREGKLHLAEPIFREAERSAASAPFALLPWQVAETENALGRCLVALNRPSEGLALVHETTAGMRSIPRCCRFR